MSKYKGGLLSNYCGLGGEGPTQHAVDVLCKEHDINYGIIQASGINPYLTHNWADKKFLDGLNRLKSQGFKEVILKQAALEFFTFKQATTPHDKSPASPEAYKLSKDEQAQLDRITPLKKMVGDRQGVKRIRADDAASAGSDSQASNAQGTVSETPIMPYYKDVAQRPYSHTQTFEVVACFHDYVTCATMTANTLPVSSVVEYKLNTPLGVNLAGTCNATAGQIVARWWDRNSLPYNFYAVMACDYKIEVLANGSAFVAASDAITASTRNDLSIKFYSFIGNGTTSTGRRPTNATDIELSHMQDVKYEGKYRATTQTAEFQDYLSIEGHYDIGSIHREVHQDASIEQWTAIASAPTYRENLLLYAVQENPHVGENVALLYKVTLRYKVQCKDLINEYQFRKYTELGVGSDNTSALS